jgi:hypothetical protein
MAQVFACTEGLTPAIYCHTLAQEVKSSGYYRDQCCQGNLGHQRIHMLKRGALSTFSCAASILVAVCISAAGCSGALNYEVAGLTDQQRIKVTNALTSDQLKKLDDWVQRNSTAGKGVPRGVTVKQAMIDQDAWLAKQSAEAAKAEELKKRAQAERAARQQEYAKLLSVTLLSKKNEVHVDGQRYVALEIAYDNKTDKAIRSVVGVLRLIDIYGEAIMDINCSYGGGIPAKQTAVDHGAIVSVNKPLDPQQKLWFTEFDGIKPAFEVNTIVFQDGTITKNPEGGA